MKARQPNLGETRCDIYLLAMEPMEPGLVVCYKTSDFKAKLVTPRRARNPRVLFGVTVGKAKTRQGVWVRYYGAADVQVATPRRKR